MFATIVRAAGANLPPVLDGKIRKTKPFFFGDDLHQISLNTDGIGKIGQVEFLREALHVCVHRYSLHDTIRVSQDHVGGLACNTREREHIEHGVWNFIFVLGVYASGRGKDVFCFRAVKPGLLNVLFELLSASFEI